MSISVTDPIKEHEGSKDMFVSYAVRTRVRLASTSRATVSLQWSGHVASIGCQSPAEERSRAELMYRPICPAWPNRPLWSEGGSRISRSSEITS